MARLIHSDRAGRQQVIDLDPQRPQVVIGRQAECDIVVHDTSVSRRHCVIVPEDGGFAVVDLGSANGTLVNDVRVTRRRLSHDDVIRCGIYAVRFIEPVEAPEDARLTLRDRYRRRGGPGEAGLRATIERLQVLNESQSQRLVQLQDELTRVDAERAAAAERLARSEAELRGAQARLAEMQAHLRHLAAALQQREEALTAALGGAPLPPGPPPPGPAPRFEPPPLEPPPPEPPPAPPTARPRGRLVEAAIAAENEALRAEIAALQGALAADDAFVRAARVVPAIDRWRAVEADRRTLDETRRRVAAAEARVRDEQQRAEARIARLEQAVAAAEARLADAVQAREAAEARAREAVQAREAAERRLTEAAAEPPAPSVLGGPGRTGALLSGLGGLGRTAVGKERARKPLTDRLAAINRHTEELELRDARIRALEAERREATRRHARAQQDARVLVDRLAAHRDASEATGMAAVQLAELVDLARAIRDTLD